MTTSPVKASASAEPMKAWLIGANEPYEILRVVIGTFEDAAAACRELHGSYQGPYDFTIAVKP